MIFWTGWVNERQEGIQVYNLKEPQIQQKGKDKAVSEESSKFT